jgi:hypothetical protein
MNAYEIIKDLLAGADSRTAVFRPLDDEGRSVFLADGQTPISLLAHPEAEDSLSFSLSAPLLSLAGASDGLQLNFLWRLTDESGPGQLPPGYGFFSDSEDLSLYLGANLSAKGLGLAGLETMADEFYRLVQILRQELSERLVNQASLSAPPPPENLSPTGYEPPPEAFLKV